MVISDYEESFYTNVHSKLKFLQQHVSRKQLGSNNWHKEQRKVAKLHEYIAK